jgi:hypothetical protein
MKSMQHPPFRVLTVGLVALALCVGASAQELAASASASSARATIGVDAATTPALGTAALAQLRRGAFEHVRFDEPGDGSLWAAGTSWKMSFDADGATYYPRFGPKAPHNYPLHFLPARVSVGGEELLPGRVAAPADDRRRRHRLRRRTGRASRHEAGRRRVELVPAGRRSVDPRARRGAYWRRSALVPVLLPQRRGRVLPAGDVEPDEWVDRRVVAVTRACAHFTCAALAFSRISSIVALVIAW